MQNLYRMKNSPCISFQKNADNHSIRDELWISAALILHYSAYLTNLHKLSMNLYKDLLPTRQVKCSWDHITPAFVEADHWNQPQAIKQERGIILVTCNSGEPQKLHWGITLPTRHVFSNGILHLLRVLCKFLLHDCRSLGFRLCALVHLISSHFIIWGARISVISYFFGDFSAISLSVSPFLRQQLKLWPILSYPHPGHLRLILHKVKKEKRKSLHSDITRFCCFNKLYQT